MTSVVTVNPTKLTSVGLKLHTKLTVGGHLPFKFLEMDFFGRPGGLRGPISDVPNPRHPIALKSSLGKLREVSQIKRAVNLNPGYSLGNNPISDSRAC